MTTGLRSRTNRWAYARETILALLVVALTFLNYGHVAASAAGGFAFTTEFSQCGDPLLPGPLDHPPCHACRIGGGADLPPPPATGEPVCFVALPVAYAAPAVEPALPVAARPALARGPPALV